MAASSTAAPGTRSSWWIRLRWRKKLGRWRFRKQLSALSFQLQQIPFIAVQIFEDRDSAIGFLAGCAAEVHAAGRHPLIVAPEVVGVQEQKDAAASLVADAAGLLGGHGSGEPPVGPGRSPRPY